MSLFDSTINNIIDEIKNLKTQYQRRSSQLRTIEYHVPLTFELEEYTFLWETTNRSKKYASISATSKNKKTGFITPRFGHNENDGYCPQVFEGGYINESVGQRFHCSVYIENAPTTDTANIDFIITSTVALENIEVEYKDRTS